MFIKPEKELYRSVYGLSRQQSWSDMDKFFSSELEKTFEAMVSSRDPVTLHQLQGKAQFIQDFRALVRDAPKMLAKLGDTGL